MTFLKGRDYHLKAKRQRGKFSPEDGRCRGLTWGAVRGDGGCKAGGEERASGRGL